MLKASEYKAAMRLKSAVEFPARRASGSLEGVVRRAAAKTLNRLKRETVLKPIGSICFEEWQECRDIIAEEMSSIIKRVVKQSTPNNQ